MQGTMPGARRRGRPRTAWMDNIKTWTGLSVEESIRMTEDRDKWRKYVHGVANPRIEDDYRTEQKGTVADLCTMCTRVTAGKGIFSRFSVSSFSKNVKFWKSPKMTFLAFKIFTVFSLKTASLSCFFSI